MSRANGVAVFWNLDDSPVPDVGPSTTTKGIRRICRNYGETIRVFKAYSSSVVGPAASASLLHTQGVTVSHSPSNSNKSVIVVHMTVEILLKVMEDKTIGTIVLIASDRDYSYMIAKVMHRGIRVVVMAPYGTACSSSCLLWPDAAVHAGLLPELTGNYLPPEMISLATSPKSLSHRPQLKTLDPVPDILGGVHAVTTGPLGYSTSRTGNNSMDVESDEEVETVDRLLTQGESEGSDYGDGIVEDQIVSAPQGAVESYHHMKVKDWSLSVDKPGILPFTLLPTGLGGDKDENGSCGNEWRGFNLGTSDFYRNCPPPSRSGAFLSQSGESSREHGYSSSPWMFRSSLSLRTPGSKSPSNDVGRNEGCGDKDGFYRNHGNLMGSPVAPISLPISWQSPFAHPPNPAPFREEHKKENWVWLGKVGPSFTSAKPPPAQFTIAPYHSTTRHPKQRHGRGKKNDRGNNSKLAASSNNLHTSLVSGAVGDPRQCLGKRKRRYNHSSHPAKKARTE